MNIGKEEWRLRTRARIYAAMIAAQVMERIRLGAGPPEIEDMVSFRKEARAVADLWQDSARGGSGMTDEKEYPVKFSMLPRGVPLRADSEGRVVWQGSEEMRSRIDMLEERCVLLEKTMREHLEIEGAFGAELRQRIVALENKAPSWGILAEMNAMQGKETAAQEERTDHMERRLNRLIEYVDLEIGRIRKRIDSLEDDAGPRKSEAD